MRTAALLLALASAAAAKDVADSIHVVRITTERATRTGPTRQTLAGPALPVGKDGLLIAVGFFLEPADAEDEAVRVSAVRPDGRVVDAELLGGDQNLECTFFRLKGDEHPEPLALKSDVRLKTGDEVRLLGRHAEILRYASRSITAHIDAAVLAPKTLYALREPLQRWVGSIVVDKEGRFVGFVDTRPGFGDDRGLMMGVGQQELVVVPAGAYAEAARTLPEKRGREGGSRAWIGVNLAPFDGPREAFFNVAEDWLGALVTGVSAGSPGDKAGIEVHDLVQGIGTLRLRYEKPEDWTDMLRAVQRLPLGEPLQCRVVRFVKQESGDYGAVPLRLTLTLEERPLDFNDAPETEIKDLGFRVRPLTQDWRRGAKLDDQTTGVVVTRTKRASQAQLAGVRIGDLILRVDKKVVKDVASFVALLNAAKRANTEKIVLFVRRGAETLFLAVETNW